MTSSTTKKKGFSTHPGSPDHQKLALNHCLMRLRERYGMRDELDMRVLIIKHLEMAKMGRVVELGEREDGSTVCCVVEGERKMYFAWKKSLKMVLTYLKEGQAYNNVGRFEELRAMRQAAVSQVGANNS